MWIGGAMDTKGRLLLLSMTLKSLSQLPGPSICRKWVFIYRPDKELPQGWVWIKHRLLDRAAGTRSRLLLLSTFLVSLARLPGPSLCRKSGVDFQPDMELPWAAWEVPKLCFTKIDNHLCSEAPSLTYSKNLTSQSLQASFIFEPKSRKLDSAGLWSQKAGWSISVSEWEHRDSRW